jgi:hypothetical protein
MGMPMLGLGFTGGPPIIPGGPGGTIPGGPGGRGMPPMGMPGGGIIMPGMLPGRGMAAPPCMGMPMGGGIIIPLPGGGIMPPPAPTMGTAMPLPAALPTPGPPGARRSLGSGGGGPSTLRDTTESPRRSTRPNTRFSSFSSFSPPPFFPLIRRNSSHSPNTRFMCLSNAMNVPIRTRASCNVIFMRYPTYRSMRLERDMALIIIDRGE